MTLPMMVVMVIKFHWKIDRIISFFSSTIPSSTQTLLFHSLVHFLLVNNPQTIPSNVDWAYKHTTERNERENARQELAIPQVSLCVISKVISLMKVGLSNVTGFAWSGSVFESMSIDVQNILLLILRSAILLTTLPLHPFITVVCSSSCLPSRWRLQSVSCGGAFSGYFARELRLGFQGISITRKHPQINFQSVKIDCWMYHKCVIKEETDMSSD